MYYSTVFYHIIPASNEGGNYMDQTCSIRYQCEHCGHVNKFYSIYIVIEQEVISEAVIACCAACKKDFVADLFQGDVA